MTACYGVHCRDTEMFSVVPRHTLRLLKKTILWHTFLNGPKKLQEEFALFFNFGLLGRKLPYRPYNLS